MHATAQLNLASVRLSVTKQGDLIRSNNAKADQLDNECVIMHENTNTRSPPRKNPRISFAATAAAGAGFKQHVPSISASRDKPQLPSLSVKLNLKVDTATDRSAVLKAINTDMLNFPKYVCKTKGTTEISLLLESISKALIAKDILENKFESLVVSKPYCTDTKLYNIVGLPYEISEAEALNSLVANNPKFGLKLCEDDDSALMIASNPAARLKIRKIVECHSGGIFRIVTEMSQSMYDILQPNSIVVEHTCCKIYEIAKHNKCFKCFRKGHIAKDCENEAACGRCAGNHLTKDCQNSFVKCILCMRKGLSCVDHASYSCPCDH